MAALETLTGNRRLRRGERIHACVNRGGHGVIAIAAGTVVEFCECPLSFEAGWTDVAAESQSIVGVRQQRGTG